MTTQNADATNTATVNSSVNKVMIGFKCNPAQKMRLSSAAKELNLTLSAYVEMLIANYDNSLEKDSTINALQAKVDFYETKILRDLYTRHKGKTIDFFTTDGFPVSLKINSIEDVFTVFVNSFKPDNND